MCAKSWCFIILSLWTVAGAAQINPALKDFVSDNKHLYGIGIKNADAISEFYSGLHYRLAWIGNENTQNRDILSALIASSAERGLQPVDYVDPVKDLSEVSLQNKADSVIADIRISATAIRFFSDLAYGSIVPALDYNGLDYSPGCNHIPAPLANKISGNDLRSFIPMIECRLAEAVAITRKIKHLVAVISDLAFAETIIITNKTNQANQPLLLKLYQLGILDSIPGILADTAIIQKVKEAQKQFNLFADGKLNKNLLQELNIPLSERLKQLNLSLNYYRWLNCLQQSGPLIVANIPATYLKVYDRGTVTTEMKIIVGKEVTPTHAIASTITEVVLYPYWYVPFSIATRELLPDIQQNPAFIDAGNYQVLNKAGKIMDPYKINWQLLSRNNFPYTIRQSTGCDNSLGILKLNFYNPYGAYLHDTPGKILFSLNKRFFSHGCIRLEKPLELARLILKFHTDAIDTLEQHPITASQTPVVIPADVRMPVVLWYNPAGIDNTGRVVFYQDVYRKFNRKKQP